MAKMPQNLRTKFGNFGLWVGLKSRSRNGILLPKLFWPTVRKKCSSDREKLLKFKAEGQEFALEQFI